MQKATSAVVARMLPLIAGRDEGFDKGALLGNFHFAIAFADANELANSARNSDFKLRTCLGRPLRVATLPGRENLVYFGGRLYPTWSSLPAMWLLLRLSGSLGALVKALAGFGVNSVAPCQGLPTADGNVDVEGIEIHPDADPICLFSPITVEPAPMNVSSTGSPRLVTSRMASAIMSTGLAVGCGASSSSRSAPNEFRYIQRFEQFRHAGRRCWYEWRQPFENANHFVLTSVERSHPGVRFCPNAKIEECQIALATSGKKFVNVPPIHAGVDKGTVRRRSPQHRKRFGQEPGELTGIQFADGFNKILVLGAPLSRRKARDRDVVRRIDKAHACAQAFTNLIDEGLIVGVATANVVATAGPDIADGSDRWLV